MLTLCSQRRGNAPVHSVGAALLQNKEEIHFFDEVGCTSITRKYTHCPKGEGATVHVAARQVWLQPRAQLWCVFPRPSFAAEVNDSCRLRRLLVHAAVGAHLLPALYFPSRAVFQSFPVKLYLIPSPLPPTLTLTHPVIPFSMPRYCTTQPPLLSHCSISLPSAPIPFDPMYRY